jgi:hypothetical protein
VLELEGSLVSRNRGDPTRLGPEDMTTLRLVWRCLSALVVVLANVAVVSYLVVERGSPAPMQSALRTHEPVSPVPTPSTTRPSPSTSKRPAPPASSVTDPEPALPAPELPGPTSTVAPVNPPPLVTIPPRTAVPSTSLPTPPSPSPSFAPRLQPGVAVSDPISNTPPSPDFLDSCGLAVYNDSFDCVSQILAAIDHARAGEGLPPMVLPTNWASLTPGQQLFVATDLERTARGLAPLGAVATALEMAADLGVTAGADPTAPFGFPRTEVFSNWAGPVGNPLEAVYYWMYDDGLGSSNIDCSLTHLSGCWGHRHNLLALLPCNLCVMGGAFGTTAVGTTGVAELIVETAGPILVNFTWEGEKPFLPSANP